MFRRLLLSASASLLVAWGIGAAAQSIPPLLSSLGAEDYGAWAENATAWAAAVLDASDYASLPTVYTVPSLSFCQSTFLQLHAMAFDRRVFFDGGALSNWTLDAFVDGLETALGPVDSLVLWFSLPQLGLDARSQFQLLLDFPGGAEGLRLAAEGLQARAHPVRILLGYVPWDSGTAPTPPGPDAGGAGGDAAVLTTLLHNASLGGAYARDADYAPPNFTTFNASGNVERFALQTDGALPGTPVVAGDAASLPLAYTPLTRLLYDPSIGGQATAGRRVSRPPANIAWAEAPAPLLRRRQWGPSNEHTQRSGRGSAPLTAPASAAAFSSYKFLEARHQALVGIDWSKSRATAIGTAFVNGAGVSLADNVFGCFGNGITPLDAALALRAATVLRFVAPLLQAPRASPSPSPSPSPSTSPSGSPSPSVSASASPSATPSAAAAAAVARESSRGGEGRGEGGGSRLLRSSQGAGGALGSSIEPPDASWLPDFPSTNAAVVVSEFYALCPQFAYSSDGGEGDERERRKSDAYNGDEGLWSAPDDVGRERMGGRRFQSALVRVADASRRALQRRSAGALRDGDGTTAGASGGGLGDDGVNCTLFLIANTGATDATGIQVNVSLAYSHVNGSKAGGAWYELVNGVTLQPEPPPSPAASAPPAISVINETLTVGLLPAGQFLALLFDADAPGPELIAFLYLMSNLSAAQPLAGLSAAWYAQNQSMTPITPSPPANAPPPGMVLIPGGVRYKFIVEAALPEMMTRPDAAGALEGYGADVQYPWEPEGPRAAHATIVDVAPYYMDQFLVANEDFRVFVAATGYDGGSNASGAGAFLRGWVDYPNGTRSYNESAGDAWRPVTWVSRNDAGAFCAWGGKRLPSEVEYQFAVQALCPGGGAGDSAFPWGSNASCDADTCAAPDASANPRSPDVRGAHPAGASSCGAQDLVGNVWHIVDGLFCDPFTCAVVLRGGSLYRPVDPAVAANASATSRYLPVALDAYHHVRVPLVNDAALRSAFVGFRCVVDTPFAAA